MPRTAAVALLALGCLALAACDRGRPPSVQRAPAVEFRAAADELRLPIRIAPDLVIRRAQFGVLESDAEGEDRFRATRELPAEDGTTFGWRIEVETTRESLHWQEHLRLPRPPADWGDVEDDEDIAISKDGRSAAAQGDELVEEGVVDRFYWSLATGDPAGDYELDLAIEGRPIAHFRFRVPTAVREKAILVHWRR